MLEHSVRIGQDMATNVRTQCTY